MKFRAHDTFAIRKGWLNKGLRNIENAPDVFISKEKKPNGCSWHWCEYGEITALLAPSNWINSRTQFRKAKTISYIDWRNHI